MNYFITGTDTDCGKTYVTALLVKWARAAGKDVVGAKPFCCGPRDDVESLAEASGHVEPLDAINPVWLKTPAAPRACEILGEPAVDVSRALSAMRDLESRHAGILCEGVGGWLVPISRGCTAADFATDLGWPVIIVARNKLGMLNHVLLTLESVRAMGLSVAGIILNNAGDVGGGATRTNRRVLEECCGCAILAEVAKDQASLPETAGLASLIL